MSKTSKDLNLTREELKDAIEFSMLKICHDTGISPREFFINLFDDIGDIGVDYDEFIEGKNVVFKQVEYLMDHVVKQLRRN